MTRTIQKPDQHLPDATDPSVRRAFLAHAAELYGLGLGPSELDVLAGLDDRAAVSGAFPQLSDEELSEALWALGRFA